MDTLEFLKTLLPSEGIKFVAQWVPIKTHDRGGIFKHKPFYDLEDMADAIHHHAMRGETVYHACSTFKELKYKTTKRGEDVPAGRTKENALAARALWLDFDVGKEVAHSYTSKKEAANSLAVMCKALDLPTPMMVDSGNGVHAYFLLEESLNRNEWEILANKFRATCDNFGLKYDPSRSSDIASILRPPGSFNLKNLNEPKPVSVKKVGVRKPVSYYEERFDAYLAAHDIVPVMPKMDFGGLNSDLITNIEYPASSAAIIVQHCSQLQKFSETGGDGEPVWHKCLGLLKHCTDGEELAHTWSANYSGYDHDETQAKMDQWEYGPTNCETFREINAEGCAGCEHSCKSPIQLGYSLPENIEHTPIQVEVDDTPQDELKVGPGSEFWPAGYRVANGRIDVARITEDGAVNLVPLVAPPFWVLNEVRSEDGEFILHCRAEIKDGKYHDFDIPTSSVSSADKLKTVLAGNRVYTLNSSGKSGFELMDLVIQQSLGMQRRREEINTHVQMGWNSSMDTFLLGKNLIHSGGITRVRVGESIASIAAKIEGLNSETMTRGTIDEYREGVTHLYGGKGNECAQYILAAAVGAYLAPLVGHNDEWHGIPMVLYSSDSGYGKTTVAAIGLNAVFYNYNSRASDGTLNFFKAMLETYGSVPVFYDELTNKLNPAEQKNFLYEWASGMKRGRLDQSGKMRDRGLMWCNMGITTTNRSVIHQLMDSGVNAESTQVRALEIDLAEYLPEKPQVSDQKLAQHLATNVYGVITERYIKLLIKNRVELAQLLETEFHDITSKLPERHASMCRFLAHHAACSIVGARIGRKLGLWDFSVANIKEWVVKHIVSQLDKITEYKVTPEDRFASMIADFNGKILITHRYDTLDARCKKARVEEPMVRLPGAIYGRYAIGCHGTKDEIADVGRLYVSVNAINEWCREHELSSAEVRKDWLDAGLIETKRGANSKGEKRVSLNLGVPSVPGSQARCVEFVVSKVRDSIADAVPRAEVRQLQPKTVQSQAQSQ